MGSGSEGAAEALQPHLDFNPILARFYAAVAERVLNPGAPIPPVDARIKAYANPFEAQLRDGCAAVAQYVAAVGHDLKRTRGDKANEFLGTRVLFGETAATISAAKKPRLNDDDGEAGDVGHTVAGGAAAAAPHPVAGFNAQDAASGKAGNLSAQALLAVAGTSAEANVRAVGNMNPLADFRTLLGYKRPELYPMIVSSMCRVIEELAGSVLDARKAVECVHLLREGCLFMHQEGAFNAFMHTLKAVHAPLDAAQLGSLFWQALRDKGVTLIVSEESGGAVATTHDEARAFLLDARVAPAAPPAPPAPPMALPSFADLEDIE